MKKQNPVKKQFELEDEWNAESERPWSYLGSSLTAQLATIGQ